jgi:hypothetical protein
LVKYQWNSEELRKKNRMYGGLFYGACILGLILVVVAPDTYIPAIPLVGGAGLWFLGWRVRVKDAR